MPLANRNVFAVPGVVHSVDVHLYMCVTPLNNSNIAFVALQVASLRFTYKFQANVACSLAWLVQVVIS